MDIAIDACSCKMGRIYNLNRVYNQSCRLWVITQNDSSSNIAGNVQYNMWYGLFVPVNNVPCKSVP